jgi:hypothetical protein
MLEAILYPNTLSALEKLYIKSEIKFSRQGLGEAVEN